MLTREEYRAWKAEIDLADTAPTVEAILTHLKGLMVHAVDDYEAAPLLDLVNYCKGKHPWANQGFKQRILEMHGKPLSTKTMLELFGFERPQATELAAAKGSIVRMANNSGPPNKTLVSSSSGWTGQLAVAIATPRIGGEDEE